MDKSIFYRFITYNRHTTVSISKLKNSSRGREAGTRTASRLGAVCQQDLRPHTGAGADKGVTTLWPPLWPPELLGYWGRRVDWAHNTQHHHHRPTSIIPPFTSPPCTLNTQTWAGGCGGNHQKILTNINVNVRPSTLNYHYDYISSVRG